MSEVDDKVGRALARFDRVMAVVDEKQGPVATQARRQRQRSLATYGRALSKAALVVLVVSVLTILVGLFVPIGIMGFVAAVALAGGIAAMLFFHDVLQEVAAPTVPTDLPNGEMVQRFDSFLYKSRRALPAPAQTVVDGISEQLGTLKQTLERVDTLDPDAQDARRLMSVHLPGLIERYANVPTAYRAEADAEGKTVDQRLVEGLEASRSALGEVNERLAKRDMDAFQTQGRFITSKYGGEDGPA
ncbi:hypothetical protein OMW55_12585 [Sphingomonas sp. BN140010]|uniref:5-bromo-4-chloroindolyl phosphate hydrolysis protein n=1 Tax=Sphingomonas arvum TaxID=2992113 RepID=A0ABT3JHX4_9SPHN|nr:hypothetical protein [Sphingomonas sp. BN140010]MCW3798644.1 hypothetical protein [Sphingomonas sp. BN140010]